MMFDDACAFDYDKQTTITRRRKIMMLVLLMMTVNITFSATQNNCTRLVAGRGHQLLIIIDAGTDHPEQQGYIYV